MQSNPVGAVGLFLSNPVTAKRLFSKMPTNVPTFPIPKTSIVFI
jgi:hypothetical protein